MIAITVCVDFDDLLAVTLPRNTPHFEQIVVITAPHDKRTMRLVENSSALYYVTDAFYRKGAKFNKGLAIEETLDNIGATGWLSMLDADIVLPKGFLTESSAERLDRECLYGARRRMCHDGTIPPEEQWREYAIAPDGEIPGCLQIFHTEASALRTRPRFGTDWTHAGGYDSVFEAKFRPDNTRWLPFEILHLGQDGVNWCGRVSPRIDHQPIRDLDRHASDMAEMWKLRRQTRSLIHEKLPL